MRIAHLTRRAAFDRLFIRIPSQILYCWFENSNICAISSADHDEIIVYDLATHRAIV
jgi:hypothetical protein